MRNHSSKASETEVFIVTELCPMQPSNFFRGRNKNLEEIKNRLFGNAKLLLLNGMGGIGKTEICRMIFLDALNGKLAEVCKIGWLTYGGSIEQTFYRQFTTIKNPADKPSDYLIQVEQYINALSGELLLFVDNANEMTEREAAWLLKLECKVLLTSRRRAIERLQAIEIGKLGIEDCRILYRQHLTANFPNPHFDYKNVQENASPDEDLDTIITMADRHTLAIELLAKTQRSASLNMKQFREILETNGFSLALVNERIAYIHNPENNVWDKEEQIFIKQFSKVLDISGIKDEKLRLIQLFSLLAPEPILADYVKDWFDIEDFEVLNTLVSKGWLSVGIIGKNGEPGFLLHPLVSAVIRYKEMPTAKIAFPLIESLREMIAYDDSNIITSKVPFLNHTLSLVNAVCEKSDEYIDLINGAAIVLLILAEYEKCMKYLKKAMDICNSTPEISMKMNSAVYHNLAECCSKLGDYKSAFELYEKSITFAESETDGINEKLATSYDNLGYLYELHADFDKSLELRKKALTIRKKILGEEHPSVAISYNNIAVLFESADDCLKALRLLKKALSIQELVLEKNHPDTATTCNNMALTYEKMGKYKTALKWYQRSLKICEVTLGSKHPDILVTQENIAGLYTDMGEYDKAMKIYKNVLLLREEIQGTEHLAVATTCHNLGALYLSTGEYACALEVCNRALKIDEKVLGLEHPYVAAVYKTIADVHKERGEYKEALELYKQVHHINIKAFGEKHTLTAISYNNLGGAYADLGQHDTALSLYQEALTIYEKVFGRNHMHTVAILQNIAASYDGQGKYENSLKLYLEVFEIARGIWKDGNPDLAVICGNIAVAYDHMENYEKANKWHQEALHIYDKYFGKEGHPNVANECYNFAVSLFQQDKLQDASALFYRVYEIISKYFGEQHELWGDTIDWMKELHEELNNNIPFDEWMGMQSTVIIPPST